MGTLVFYFNLWAGSEKLRQLASRITHLKSYLAEEETTWA